jgi:hypothetical protein
MYMKISVQLNHGGLKQIVILRRRVMKSIFELRKKMGNTCQRVMAGIKRTWDEGAKKYSKQEMDDYGIHRSRRNEDRYRS